MNELEEARLKVLEMFEKNNKDNGDKRLVDTWVKWFHKGNKPARTQEEKSIYVENLDLKHCSKCKNLNGCCFLKRNMPVQPVHENCHCETIDIPKPIAKISALAKCPIEKITKYAFVNEAKKRFFEMNGYDIIDAEWMKGEFEHQALEKYINGDYHLGKLDVWGQRITIWIEFPNRIGGDNNFGFFTGWLVYPDGVIINNTPATDLSEKNF